MLKAVVSAFRIPDLRRRILFTLAILVIFRIISHVPLPGITSTTLDKINTLLSDTGKGSNGVGSVLGFLDIFSGGSIRQFSIATTGVYPYITAQIIIQLLIPVVGRLTELSKEGERGRLVINRLTHYLTVPIAVLTGYGQITLLKSQGAINANQYRLFGADVTGSETLTTLAALVAIAAATMILVWMGELITEFGIGNGVSIIIFGGIVAGLPGGVIQLRNTSLGQNIFIAVVLVILVLVAIVGIVLIQEGQRRIQVRYPRQQRGNRVYGGQDTYIPLKVNSAGMIPLIFASSILIFPSTIANFFIRSNDSSDIVSSIARFVVIYLGPSSLGFIILDFLLVVGFTYFYSLVLFNQQNITETLRDRGGFVPGMRPGKPTNDYLQRVLTRITLLGALFLGTVSVAPYLIGFIVGVQVTLYLQASSLLIVVGVAVDTMKQLEAQLVMRQYKGFLS